VNSSINWSLVWESRLAVGSSGTTTPGVATIAPAAATPRCWAPDKGSRRRPLLSGGQQPGGAAARAIVTTPAVVRADEPTANLDSHTSDQLMELFTQLNANHKTTFVIATHDQRVMEFARRLIRMLDGRIVEDIRQEAA
jgi:energy-coupling factor transporter ATP-binding protein EcfA2